MARQMTETPGSYTTKDMKLDLPLGKYVVAVSGGVDSVVLLHLLAQIENEERRMTNDEKKNSAFLIPHSPFTLVVAHFDHGIRADSAKDRLFVEKLVTEYSLEFAYDEGKLGVNASEAEAREARYKFLRSVMSRTKSEAIVTAHHQDDVIETAIINLLRGTKAKGLSSLKSTAEIIRPLLSLTKAQIIKYANDQGLTWREDPSNQDPKYLRNYVRLNLIPKMTLDQRQQLLEIIKTSADSSREISRLMELLLPEKSQTNRDQFINLPHAVAKELVASWLRKEGLNIDQKTVERLVVALKSAKNGVRLDINKNFQFIVKNGIIEIQPGK